MSRAFAPLALIGAGALALWAGAPAPVFAAPRAPAARPVTIAALADTLPARLDFAGVPWRSDPEAAAAALARAGFTPAAEGGCRGRWLGHAAALTVERDPSGRLVAITLRFEPETLGGALALYADLCADMRRRHGRPYVQIAPGRPMERVLNGRHERLVSAGEPAAASLWVARSDDAAAVQMDGQHVVWLRYEAAGWKAPR